MQNLTETATFGPIQVDPSIVPTSISITATEAAGAHVGNTVPYAPADNGAGVLVQAFPPLALDVGTWTIGIQAIDQNGAGIGDPVIDPTTYVVAAPTTITVQVPIAATGVLA